ncbi:MAG: hypothetical protein HWN68_13205 [Desulfobacterales bacterium]|nr:hypothetical protein [Desulfobacterales bacterium]
MRSTLCDIALDYKDRCKLFWIPTLFRQLREFNKLSKPRTSKEALLSLLYNFLGFFSAFFSLLSIRVSIQDWWSQNVRDNLETKSVLAICMLILGLTTLRSYHAMTTGFLLPDEGLYVHAKYGDFYIRPFFTQIFSVYTFLLGANTLADILVVGPFFGALWTVGAIMVFHQILKFTAQNERDHTLALCSFVLMPICMLLSPTWLTEPMGLCCTLTGIWGLLFYFKGNATNNCYALASVLAFTVAAIVRESYWLFFAGNFMLLIAYFAFRKKASCLVLALFLVGIVITAPPQVTEALSLPYAPNPWVVQVPPSDKGFPIFGLEQDRYPISFNVLASSLWKFASSIGIGWNPTIAIFVVCSLILSMRELYRTRDTILAVMLANAFFGFVAFALMCFYLSTFTFVYSSTVIRFSHVTLPSAILLPKAYHHLKSKRRITIAMGLTVVALVPVVLAGLPTIQSGFPEATVSRLSFGYEAPYYRLYKYVDGLNGTTLIFAEPMVRAKLFLRDNPNVTMLSFQKENFQRETNGCWSRTLVYGELYPNYLRALEENEPFFADLIQNKTNRKAETIWWNTESYLLRLK